MKTTKVQILSMAILSLMITICSLWIVILVIEGEAKLLSFTIPVSVCVIIAGFLSYKKGCFHLYVINTFILPVISFLLSVGMVESVHTGTSFTTAQKIALILGYLFFIYVACTVSLFRKIKSDKFEAEMRDKETRNAAGIIELKKQLEHASTMWLRYDLRHTPESDAWRKKAWDIAKQIYSLKYNERPEHHHVKHDVYFAAYTAIVKTLRTALSDEEREHYDFWFKEVDRRCDEALRECEVASAREQARDDEEARDRMLKRQTAAMEEANKLAEKNLKAQERQAELARIQARQAAGLPLTLSDQLKL